MSAEAAVPARAAFQYPDYRRYTGARAAAMLAAEMQSVAVGWQVYSITQRPLDLGLVGLAQFVPFVILSPLGGHIADRFERRAVLAVCYGLNLMCAAALAALALSGARQVIPIYGILLVLGAARAFATPSQQALLPSLVPLRHFPNAVTWATTVRQIATIAGPALGGVVFAAGGAASTFGLCAAILAVAIALTAGIRTRPAALEAEPLSWATLSAGFRYVWRHQMLLGAMSMDLFAVLLGGAVALLPIYARDILLVGPTGLGLLRSAPAFGAASMALALAYFPLRRRAGPTMLGCVAIFGAATVAFGLSRSFALSLAMLAVLGAADMVSMVVRLTLEQIATPESMRGRVGAVNGMFIGASNELGEFESGVTAWWLGTVPAVVVGGLGTLAVVALWSWWFPQLRRIDRLEALAPE